MYAVFQPGGEYITSTLRAKRRSSRKAFMVECNCDDWRTLRALGFRTLRIGQDWRGQVKAQPLSEPGLLLPGIEHEQKPAELVKLLVAQFQAYRQPNHDKKS